MFTFYLSFVYIWFTITVYSLAAVMEPNKKLNENITGDEFMQLLKTPDIAQEK